MPTLFRFLVVIGLVAGTVYGGMWALAHFVKPQPREIVVHIPPGKLGQ